MDTKNNTNEIKTVENKKDFIIKTPKKEKELELKMLSNLQPRKLNKNYVEKFVTLLHQSKDLKPNYFKQRRKLKLNPIKSKNINHGRNVNRNGIYITLPKLDDNIQNQNMNTYDNKDDYSISVSQIISDEERNKNESYSNNLLTDTIRNIVYKNTDNNLDIDLYEQKEKLLYDKLKTKEQFHLNDLNNKNSLYLSTDANKLINIYNYSNNNSPKKRKKFLSPLFVKNFDESLAKSMEKDNMNKLTKNQMKKLYYISELKLFDSFDKIREKNKILNEMKNYQKKKYLNNLDMFRYDKEKWEKKRSELNKNINDIMFKRFNSENKEYLTNMRNVVDKLHENKNSIEKDLGPFLNDLNIFIDRNSEYLKENNPSNLESRLHSNRASFSRKPRMSLKNPKILSLQDKLIL